MVYLNKKPLLEDSFNSFVRSIDIAYALMEDTRSRPEDEDKDGNKKRNSERSDRDRVVERDAPYISDILKSHQNDIKDIKQATQNLKDMISSSRMQNQYDRELQDKKFDELKNVSYEPMTITKQNRPFTGYAFPFNILYLAKQIFVWIGNFLTKAFAKIAEVVASLTGNKMQASISLAKDAFIKEEEFMKGTYLPIVFKSEKESIQKIGQSEIITYGSKLSDGSKYAVREDYELLSESFDMKEKEKSQFVVYDMNSNLVELKKYMATFLQFYDSMQGSFGENLIGVEDIEQLYTLFHDQLEAIKVIKSGAQDSAVDLNMTKRWDEKKYEDSLIKNNKSIIDTIKNSYAKLEFRVDPKKIKGILDTTLFNTDKLKQTYKIVEKKVVDILGELLNYQNNLFKQTGSIYSAFSGETMTEMILLTDMYEEKIAGLTGQIRSINETKNKLGNLLKGFSNISGIFGGYNIAQLGNYQVESSTEITKISNDIRQVVVMLIQTVQLRYDNAYRYLDVLSSIRDLIVSISSINANRNKYMS
jgi:hypothetical protein